VRQACRTPHYLFLYPGRRHRPRKNAMTT
jgi:hypothetical protein